MLSIIYDFELVPIIYMHVLNDLHCFFNVHTLFLESKVFERIYTIYVGVAVELKTGGYNICAVDLVI